MLAPSGYPSAQSWMVHMAHIIASMNLLLLDEEWECVWPELSRLPDLTEKNTRGALQEAM